jgi:hypothetical protein
MTTDKDPFPLIEFKTKDIANFADLIKQAGRLFVLKNTPVVEALQENRHREVLRAHAHISETMFALLIPFNAVVTGYSDLRVNFCDSAAAESSVEIVANAYVHPEGGNPAFMKEAQHRILLVLDRG